MSVWGWPIERALPKHFVGGIRNFGCCGSRGSDTEIIGADSLDAVLLKLN